MSKIRKFQNIFFYAGALILILIIVSGFIEPIIKQKFTADWNGIVVEKVNKIESGLTAEFKKSEEKLLNASDSFRNFLEGREQISDSSLSVLSEQIGIADLAYDIYDKSNKLNFWTRHGFTTYLDRSGLSYSEGETFFIDNNLMVYFAVYGRTENFSYFIGFPIHKKYKLENKFYSSLDFIKKISDEHETQIEIEFSNIQQVNYDGRKYSFNLYNNYKNQIASVVVLKPQRDKELKKISNYFRSLQSLLASVSILLFGIGFFGMYKQITNKAMRLPFLFGYLFAVRYILKILGLPSALIQSEISDPKYFSSQFAFGFVATPIDLLITLIFFLVFAIQIYRYFTQLQQEDALSDVKLIILAPVSISLFAFTILLIRGFGAAVKSVIYDSSLRYFKNPELFPDIPALIMHFNVLLIGFCSVLFGVVFIAVVLYVYKIKARKHFVLYSVLIFLLLQLAALAFDLIQQEPQGTVLVRILFLLIVFILSYSLVTNRKNSAINFTAYFFAASLLSVSLLDHYNSDLEKKSLRAIAKDITKSNEDYIEKTINSILSDRELIKELRESIKHPAINYNATAFRIWANSELSKSSLSSTLNIISSQKDLIGTFSYQFQEEFIWDWTDRRDSIVSPKIKWETIYSSKNKIIRGIVPIKNKNIIQFYLEINSLYDLYSFNFLDNPDFISSDKIFNNSALDFSKIKIFDFQDNELVNYYTDIILSEKEKKNILGSQFINGNENWLDLEINHQPNLIYVKKFYEDDIERTIAVSLEKKNYILKLFDFFKVFFIHSLFITPLLLALFLFNLKRPVDFNFSFRGKLLISFLVISILPLILLAVYFRNLTDEKNIDSVYYKLGKRADKVEEYISEYLNESSLTEYFIFEKVTKDLGINYEIFRTNYLVYSSESDYYNSGLIPKVIDPKAFNELYREGLQEFVNTEKIEEYEFHSFYHKANIGGTEYLIKVSDVFNKIRLPMTGSEVDVFLFGSYSLAVILIIMVSTLFANQISSPIRKLTKATKSVAHGDLSISVEVKGKGEINDLVQGFNNMVKDLKRSQFDLAEMEREIAWKEMAKQVAHEIKNPLTPMKLAVQQLIAAQMDKAKKFDEIFEKVTTTLLKQIDILKNIASEFSSFGRMPKLKMENLDLIKLLNSVSSLFMEEKLELNIINQSEKTTIESDSDNLQRTFINLIRNSIQAGATKIDFRIMGSEENLILFVEDNGLGISSEIEHKIFDENFTTKIEGMGIGLSLAKRFLESINSSISVESTSPKGTTLKIIFPASR
ncbi:MAG: ATP-binding protein [Bacteroidota bacterium]